MSNETSPSTVPNFENLSQAELRAIVHSKSPYSQIAFDYLSTRFGLFGGESIERVARRVGIPPVGVGF